MARKKSVPAPSLFRRIRRRVGLFLCTLLILCLVMVIGWMHVSSQVVQVRRAEVLVPDLPASFDGTTILFASDIDLCGLNTPDHAGRLFRRLQALSPDVLLLGGDYASPNLVDRLNGNASTGDYELREAFFREIASFTAPMGKYAITGDNDGAPEALTLITQKHGVQLIDGALAVLQNDADAIGIAGIGARTEDVSSLAGRVRSDQCVIALAHSPESVIDIRISEASGGGTWADLILTGHTHGGQINIAGRSIFTLTDTEKKYLSGWHEDGRAPLLVTTGVGCVGVNLRLSTLPEVWLLTLRNTLAPAPVLDMTF